MPKGRFSQKPHPNPPAVCYSGPPPNVTLPRGLCTLFPNTPFPRDFEHVSCINCYYKFLAVVLLGDAVEATWFPDAGPVSTIFSYDGGPNIPPSN